MFDPVLFWPVAIVILAAGSIAAIAVLRAVRARRKARRRVVEAPNSHYTSQLAQHREARHRWHDIDLDRMHEINREEVERLLAKVEAIGVDTLREDERVFLDYMAELTGKKSPPETREKGAQIAPDLRHRPA